MGRFDPSTEHMLKHGYNDSSEDKSFIDQTDGMVCIHIGFCVHRCLYTRVAQIFMSFENPSADQVEQIQTIAEQGSKCGCLGIVVLGIVLTSIIVFL